VEAVVERDVAGEVDTGIAVVYLGQDVTASNMLTFWGLEDDNDPYGQSTGLGPSNQLLRQKSLFFSELPKLKLGSSARGVLKVTGLGSFVITTVRTVKGLPSSSLPLASVQTRAELKVISEDKGELWVSRSGLQLLVLWLLHRSGRPA